MVKIDAKVLLLCLKTMFQTSKIREWGIIREEGKFSNSSGRGKLMEVFRKLLRWDNY